MKNGNWLEVIADKALFCPELLRVGQPINLVDDVDDNDNNDDDDDDSN